MHELGIVIQIVKQLESYMLQHEIEQIEVVVLQIGALSSIYPKYLEDVYPMAIESSKLKNTRLEIDVSPGIGKCTDCEFVYNLVENQNRCPRCASTSFSIISGKEFLIKQIVVDERKMGGKHVLL